jgi:uncharacterized OsmC-like protein
VSVVDVQTVPVSNPEGLGDSPTDLWVERTGTRTYVGRNGRGAEVRVGPVTNEGSFSPGELLKIALAACTGLTIDTVIARRLGDDVPLTIVVAGPKDQEADSYPLLTENIVVDMDGLSDKDRERLLVVTGRAAEEHCTVARTITKGTTIELSVNGSSLH